MRRLEHHKKDNDTRPHREQSQDNQRDPVSESHEEDPSEHRLGAAFILSQSQGCKHTGNHPRAQRSGGAFRRGQLVDFELPHSMWNRRIHVVRVGREQVEGMVTANSFVLARGVGRAFDMDAADRQHLLRKSQFPQHRPLFDLVHPHALKDVGQSPYGFNDKRPFVKHHAFGPHGGGGVGDFGTRGNAALGHRFEHLCRPDDWQVRGFAHPQDFLLDLGETFVAAFDRQVSAGDHHSGRARRRWFGSIRPRRRARLLNGSAVFGLAWRHRENTAYRPLEVATSSLAPTAGPRPLALGPAPGDRRHGAR